MADNANLSKWDKLKLWVGKRHDYFEQAYHATNFSADSAEMGAYRSVFQAMRDLEEQERIAAHKSGGLPANPTQRSRK